MVDGRPELRWRGGSVCSPPSSAEVVTVVFALPY